MFKTVSARIKSELEQLVFWENQCKHSNSLFNSALYYAKQKMYLKAEITNRTYYYWNNDEYKEYLDLGYFDTSLTELCTYFKDNVHYQSMAAQSAQQVLHKVIETLNSYNALLKNFFKALKNKERGVKKPGLPRYRSSGGLFEVSFPLQALNCSNGKIFPSISRGVKNDLLSPISLESPDCVPLNMIREATIRPVRGEFWVYWTLDDGKLPYLLTQVNPLLNQYEAIGIDPGIRNWMTVVCTTGKSFIVDGQKLRGELRFYRDAIKKIKTGKPEKYWDWECEKLTHKIKKHKKDAINKACRFLINYCLRNKVGNIVFGRNKQAEQNVNTGRKNNYDITQMPIGKVIERLKQLCSEYGITLTVTEESYSSKSSYLDSDFIPVYGCIPGEFGAKPENWKPSGTRTKRGMYLTKNGLFVNADTNGSANILRKVATQLGLSLAKVVRGIMTVPHRYDVFKNISKSYRKTALRSADLSHVVTTF